MCLQRSEINGGDVKISGNSLFYSWEQQTNENMLFSSWGQSIYSHVGMNPFRADIIGPYKHMNKRKWV